jgi:hypothetical protein
LFPSTDFHPHCFNRQGSVKKLYVYWLERLLLLPWHGQGGPCMKLLTGRIFLGATLAISLGGFAFPVSASVPPLKPTRTVSTKVSGIQIAQAARDIDEKANEVNNATTGAVNSAEAVHRRHERNEYRHRTIGSKVDSKMSEVKNETRAAGHAVERAHEQHEAVEHAEGRD